MLLYYSRPHNHKMRLEVNVISYKGQPSHLTISSTSFGQEGGTIGRSKSSSGNHLTLPDPERFISRTHASIRYENGQYYLKDTSVDGTYIQNKNKHVSQETIAIDDGDEIRIGEYILSVRVLFDTFYLNNITPGDSGFKDQDIYDLNSDQNISELPLNDPSDFEEDRVDWQFESTEKEFGIEDSQKTSTTANEKDSPLHDAFAPPDLVNEQDMKGEIPDGFDFQDLIQNLDSSITSTNSEDSWEIPDEAIVSNLDTPETCKTPPPINEPEIVGISEHKMPGNGHASSGPPPPFSASSQDLRTDETIREQTKKELMQAFLDAAGIHDTSIIQNGDITRCMQTIGIVFREMIEGLMTVLRGRSEMKMQFRVAATLLKPEDNNPFKFFPNAEDAFKQLLTSERKGFVSPVNSVHEGFKDLINHQLATTAGIQATVIDLLRRFEPRHFAGQFEKGSIFNKKAKSWEAYEQSYPRIVNEILDDIFGDAFGKAYEEQIRKLRSKTNNNNV